MGPCRIEGYLRNYHSTSISHTTIHKILNQAGLNNPIPQPRKTWGKHRFERPHSNQPLAGMASSAAATILFTFYCQYLERLSYSVQGGGSGYSAPIFQANQFGSVSSVVLTTTTMSYWFDYGSSWSVTPNPLTGSTSSERWSTTQTTSGRVTGSATRAFTFRHQFYLTMQVSSSSAGLVSPSSGWHNAGQRLTISARAKTGHTFLSWSGTGTGSYIGTMRWTAITMNSPITETANFA